MNRRINWPIISPNEEAIYCLIANQLIKSIEAHEFAITTMAPQPALPAASWSSPPPKSPAEGRRCEAGPQEVPRRFERSPSARPATSTAPLRGGTARNDLPRCQMSGDCEPCHGKRIHILGWVNTYEITHIWVNNHPSSSTKQLFETPEGT